MQLRDFLAAEKTVDDAGAWSDKKMPKTGGKFPMTKNRSYRLGSGFRWRVAEITAEGAKFRLLIAHNPWKEQYVAALGVASGGDTLVLARLEYHGTHRGWHVHGYCGMSDANHWGRMNYPDMVRIPDGKSRHRRIDYRVDDDEAVSIAADFFRIVDLKPPAPRWVQTSIWGQ
jgi:hypothetical protein